MIEMDWLARWALFARDRVALVDADYNKNYTYSECFTNSCRLANALRERYGIQKGDRVALLAQNEIESVFLFFALQRLGAVLVPYNFRLTKTEMEYLVDDTKPSLLIYQNEFAETVQELQFDRALSFENIFKALVTDEGISSDPGVFQAQWDDACMILYTSGTTGKPKGAVLTPKSIFWNSVNTALRLDIHQSDCFVNFLPLFHTGGWNVLMTPFFHHGARTVFLRKFDADRVLELSDQHNASLIFGVPTTMDMMARSRAFKRCDLASVRYAIVGGEAMPIPLIQKWQDKGVPIRQGYGLTEFGPNCFSLNEGDAKRKIGSIGFPNFYVDARVVDDAGNDVGPGKTGELILRGPACMKEYWRNPEATAKTIKDGWLYTGDLMQVDQEGYFYLVDRKKDMFISGGENVYPLEVEQTLRKHPAIREAAVIGVPDQKWGEVGKAFVVAESSDLPADELIRFCSDKLAKFKIPKHLTFLPELPKGDSGKVLKRALREM